MRTVSCNRPISDKLAAALTRLDRPMPYSPEIIAELRILARYNLDTSQEGIKVHSSADPEVIDAAQRLHSKGLITQTDGGYLTSLGRTAAEHAQDLLQILGDSG